MGKPLEYLWENWLLTRSDPTVAPQSIPGEIIIFQTNILSDLGELGKLTIVLGLTLQWPLRRCHPPTHPRGRERVLQSLFLRSRNLTYLAFITFAIEQRKLFFFTFPCCKGLKGFRQGEGALTGGQQKKLLCKKNKKQEAQFYFTPPTTSQKSAISFGCFLCILFHGLPECICLTFLLYFPALAASSVCEDAGRDPAKSQ